MSPLQKLAVGPAFQRLPHRVGGVGVEYPRNLLLNHLARPFSLQLLRLSAEFAGTKAHRQLLDQKRRLETLRSW